MRAALEVQLASASLETDEAVFSVISVDGLLGYAPVLYLHMQCVSIAGMLLCFGSAHQTPAVNVSGDHNSRQHVFPSDSFSFALPERYSTVSMTLVIECRELPVTLPEGDAATEVPSRDAGTSVCTWRRALDWDMFTTPSDMSEPTVSEASACSHCSSR